MYLAAFGFQGQGTQELGVAGVGTDDAFITARRGDFANVCITLGVARAATE